MKKFAKSILGKNTVHVSNINFTNSFKEHTCVILASVVILYFEIAILFSTVDWSSNHTLGDDNLPFCFYMLFAFSEALINLNTAYMEGVGTLVLSQSSILLLTYTYV